MAFLLKIKDYLDSFESKEFKKYLLIALAIIALLAGLLMFQYYRSVWALKTKITAINRKRRDVQNMLERYERVKKQQIEVNSILAKEKDFKISQYFENLLERLGISKNLTQPPETLPKDVLDGYTEWTLYANLANLNTKKLSELLYTIEQEERIYTKELEIEKSSTGDTINVKITIATLEPKPELQKSSE
jgi:hypothetical protein